MTKRELRDYHHLQKQIRLLDGEIDEWRSRAEYSTRAPDRRAVVGDDTDPYPYIMDKITECERVRAAKIKKLNDINTALELLDERESLIMRAHYCAGLTWEQISDIVGYSTAQIHRIHNAALSKMM